MEDLVLPKSSPPKKSLKPPPPPPKGHGKDCISSSECAPGLTCNNSKCECKLGSHQGAPGCTPSLHAGDGDHECCQSNWGEGCHGDTNYDIEGMPSSDKPWNGYQWCGPGLSCVKDHENHLECECSKGTHSSSRGACNTKGDPVTPTDGKDCCCNTVDIESNLVCA